MDNDMLTSGFTQTCVCRRTFSSPSAFRNHENSCLDRKQNLSDALALARRAIAKRKESKMTTSGLGRSTPEPDDGAKDSEVTPTTNTRRVTNDDSQELGGFGPVFQESSHSTGNLVQDPPAKRRRLLPARLANMTMHDDRLRDTLPEALSGTVSSAVPIPGAVAGSITDPPLLPAVSSSPLVATATRAELVRQIDTLPNVFQVFRRYHATSLPAHDPEMAVDIEMLSNIIVPSAPDTSDTNDSESIVNQSFSPYPNRNCFELGQWYWNEGAQKSQDSFRKLVEIVGRDDFVPADVRAVNWTNINRRLGLNQWDKEEWEDDDAGWLRSSVTIQVPFHRYTDHPGVRPYVVNGFYHRSLSSVIREKLTLRTGDIPHFHLEPYEMRWNRGGEGEAGKASFRLQGELYTSPAFIKAHQELQSSPGEPGCDLPRVVVALMFWSDGTQLTTFGNAKLCPLYMYFGNESKYRRCRPSNNLAEHVAYFEQLPDDFKDFASNFTGKNKIKSEFMSYCNRELAHEQWRLLLDDEFLYAYQHGLVIEWDGTPRRFYPRIMTYSADYQEKVLMAGVRHLGGCPCPRCKVPKGEAHLFGTNRDREKRTRLERLDDQHRQKVISESRNQIYQQNFAIDSAYVERRLKGESLVPNMNAFSARLSGPGFGLKWHSMFVIDLMHEIELGVWKALFIHLLRIVESLDESLLHELDRRFRMVPTFGRDTIRRFSRNSSELKKMAARDYEDFLQCSIPVFEGLIPEPYNTSILNLLFRFAHWHGLAKLRLHSDLTLELLDKETSFLGEALRAFRTETCPQFKTRELRKEATARERKAASSKVKGDGNTRSRARTRTGKAVTVTATGQPSVTQSPVPAPHEAGPSDGPHAGAADPNGGNGPAHNVTPNVSSSVITSNKPAPAPSGRRARTFNMNTYKAHAMGDYVATIKEYGTTDSYSTEVGELEHRVPKGNYKRTSKKEFQMQLARIERRQTRLRRLKHSLRQIDGGAAPSMTRSQRRDDDPSQPTSDPTVHHQIGLSENLSQHIGSFLQENSSDPAVKNFMPHLKSHLLQRLRSILNIANTSAASSALASSSLDEDVYFNKDLMYRHNLLRINYTTYDIRRSQDTINPKTDHRDVMLLSDRTPAGLKKVHEYRYGRVIGIFHVNAIYAGPSQRNYTSHRLEFLWVRWFEAINDGPVANAWSSLSLDRLKFPSMNQPGAFGFVDPAEVLRGCHIVPGFAGGQRHAKKIGLSACAGDGDDWFYYVLNRFVDRDMIMRFHWGLGVGHLYGRHVSTREFSTQTAVCVAVESSHVPESDGTRIQVDQAFTTVEDDERETQSNCGSCASEESQSDWDGDVDFEGMEEDNDRDSLAGGWDSQDDFDEEFLDDNDDFYTSSFD